jgi:far upstream element-binding protein
MSEQPNISQILAALGMAFQSEPCCSMAQRANRCVVPAAQRPGGTPAQGQLPPQQQPVPQPYQAPYQNSVPPPGPTPYPLPQPTSSGNVDLSNIRPTNSGSVSLADAIARARGIAAEKGVSYDVSRAG